MYKKDSAKRSLSGSILCCLVVGMFAVAVSVSSCASAKKTDAAGAVVDGTSPEQTVRIAHPYEFFDFDKDLYVTFPVKGNEQLLSSFIMRISPKISSFSLNQLITKTSFFYLANNFDFLSEKDKTPVFQFVATGSFPQSYRSLLFTSGNGFREVIEKQKDKEFNYFYNNDAKFYIDIPLTGYCLADTEFLSGMLTAQQLTRTGQVYDSQWPQPVNEQMLVTEDDGVIDWYLAKPAPVVAMLLGPKVKLPVSYAFGTMTRIPAQPKESMLYSVTATLEMVNARFVKPNIAVIKMFTQKMQVSADYPAATVESNGEAGIVIKGLVIDFNNFIKKEATNE